MGILLEVDKDGRKATVILNGRFTADGQGAFKETLSRIDEDIDQYCLDLRQVSFLDSSAMTELLGLRKHADLRNKKISILCTRDGQAEEILLLANFDKIFHLESL